MNQKDYNRTPKGAYIRQRSNANRRGIPWDFTFETWWEVWEQSGKWEERGVGRSAYAMCRINDEGPYSPGNVEIKAQWENRLEYLERRWKQQDEAKWRPYERTTAWEYPHSHLDEWRAKQESTESA